MKKIILIVLISLISINIFSKNPYCMYNNYCYPTKLHYEFNNPTKISSRILSVIGVSSMFVGIGMLIPQNFKANTFMGKMGYGFLGSGAGLVTVSIPLHCLYKKKK